MSELTLRGIIQRAGELMAKLSTVLLLSTRALIPWNGEKAHADSRMPRFAGCR